MSFTACEKKICIHWRSGHCELNEPEKIGESCLDFEDTIEFLRLKADAVKGTLG